jgi:hypothetical protein
MRSLPRLEDVRIAAPCPASWEAMKGDDRVRFCAACGKDVYNLSALPRVEAEQLLAERGGSICKTLYLRADGTVITADCPVGVVRRLRVRRVLAVAAGAGALALATALYRSPPRAAAPVAATPERIAPAPTSPGPTALAPEFPAPASTPESCAGNYLSPPPSLEDPPVASPPVAPIRRAAASPRPRVPIRRLTGI